MDLSAQKRFSEQGWHKIIEKQKQLRPATNTTTGLAVERDNGFRCDLPSDGHIGQSRVHRGGGLLSPW
jgi:hypothetical protein